MPGVNWPAVEARTRTSPIDRQNMNRAFPGHPTSGPTAAIADFIERVLLPHVAVAVDLHSGGTQSVYTPCGYVYGMGARDFRARKLAAAHAFGAPVTAVVKATSSTGSLSAACSSTWSTSTGSSCGSREAIPPFSPDSPKSSSHCAKPASPGKSCRASRRPWRRRRRPACP